MESLLENSKRTLAKLSFKSNFDGATVKTRFTVKAGDVRPNVRWTYEIETSRNLELRTRSEERIDLDTRVREAVAKTESTLIEKKLYNPGWICQDSLEQLSEYHDYFLKKNLDGTKIGILTEFEAGNPAQESSCQCDTHKVTHHVTGRSLRHAGYAVVTKQVPGDRSLTFFHSKCYRRMPTETASIEDAPPDLPPTKRETIDRFLETLDAEMANTVNTLPIADHFEWLKFLGHGATSNKVYEHAINSFTMEEPYRSMDHIILNPEDRIDAQIGDEWTSFDYKGDKYDPIEGSTSAAHPLRKPAFW